MGKPNPLLTVLVDRSLLDLDPVKELIEAGHKVVTANFSQFNVVWSPKAMFLQRGLEGYAKLALTKARREVREQKAKEKAEAAESCEGIKPKRRSGGKRKSKDGQGSELHSPSSGVDSRSPVNLGVE